MKVLEFISTLDESLKIVMDPKTIMDPWRVSHLRSDKFRKAFPDADKYLDAIEATFPLLVPDPVIPAADEYQRKLSFEITEALAKRKSAKDALDNAVKEWDKITERRGLEKQKAHLLAFSGHHRDFDGAAFDDIERLRRHFFRKDGGIRPYLALLKQPQGKLQLIQAAALEEHCFLQKFQVSHDFPIVNGEWPALMKGIIG